MSNELHELWFHMTASPLLGLSVTVLAYLAGRLLYQLSGDNPLCNPVAIAIIVLIAFLLVTGTPYPTYFEGAQFVHFLLGPAVVAMGVPLYLHAARIRQLLLPLCVALVAGSITAITSAMAITGLLGGSWQTLLSLAPKSATTPVAMGIAEKIGGLPSLTAALVILTGIIGAVSGSSLLNLLKLRDPSVQGFALGVAAHGIGTARAFQLSEQSGAFAGIGIGLNALLTTVLVPVVVALLLDW
jgi:predicted murein hydrolase (TIGR00659 family)